MGKYILECCVDSVESAIEAEKGGANRLELCANLIIGGTSPSLALFKEVKENTNLMINVLLRPRFGDFLYSNHEFAILKEEVRLFKEAGADGVVIGCLRADGTMDYERMKELINIADGIHVTLHRAFDMTNDPHKALEEAKQLGINTILTSGQRNSALEGKELIKELILEAGEDLEILVGSGVNAKVIEEFLKDSNAYAFHMSGKEVLSSNMIYKNEMVCMGLPMMSEYEIWKTDYKKIQAAKMAIKSWKDLQTF